MAIEITKQSSDQITISVTIELTGTMLEMEESIQRSLNEVGAVATGKALEKFDTDGTHIKMGDVKFYSMGKRPQVYESPYGPVQINRYIYQTSKGGRSFVPLEERARMIKNSTPKYARQVTSKYSQMGAPAVRRDLAENHGRSISLDYIKKLTDFIGMIINAKEAHWEYDIPELPNSVETISVGLDGTCMYLSNGGGWREAMCGTISLYNTAGERMHTIYVGATPEYGKGNFLTHLDKELSRTKAKYPSAFVQGLADGAADNWKWLYDRVNVEVLDFYHLSEYVFKAGEILHGAQETEKKEWVESWLNNLKHNDASSEAFLNELFIMKQLSTKTQQTELSRIEKYVENQQSRLGYAEELRHNRPIGSGVTEAACKTLIKARMCQAGMRWKSEGASAVIALRALEQTPSRWEQFWNKIMQYGL